MSSAGQGAAAPPADRFTVHYTLTCATEEEARRLADAVCIEQTVEYPADLVEDPWIRAEVFGRVTRLEPHPASPGTWHAELTFAVPVASGELTQLLNVCFGNASLLTGVRLAHIAPSAGLLASLPSPVGPRFGREGLRASLGVPRRPLLATALKPLGLSPRALADLAACAALGGVDIIKDDHGLADQPYARFTERVVRAAAAVGEANVRTGGRSLYAPNVTAPAAALVYRAHEAKQAGAGALLVAPGLVGWDAMAALARDPGLGLPILAHPALLGGHVASTTGGIAHAVLFADLARLAGADVTIFPHCGGRFPFTAEDCKAVAGACAAPLAGLSPILPAPAGGMSLEKAADLVDFYGMDVVLLIGGDLHRHGGDVTANAKRLREWVERLPGPR